MTVEVKSANIGGLSFSATVLKWTSCGSLRERWDEQGCQNGGGGMAPYFESGGHNMVCPPPSPSELSCFNVQRN